MASVALQPPPSAVEMGQSPRRESADVDVQAGIFASPVKKPMRQNSADMSTDDDAECASTAFGTPSSSFSSYSCPSYDAAGISPLLLPEADPQLDDTLMPPLSLSTTASSASEAEDCVHTTLSNKVIEADVQRCFTSREVSSLRKFVRSLVSKGDTSCRLEKQLLAAGVSSCALEVARLASFAAASAAILPCTKRVKAEMREQVNTGILRGSSSQIESAKRKLAQCMRKWRDARTHDRQLIRHFAKLCREQASNTVHRELARATVLSPKDKESHYLQARIADIRAEMGSDLCTVPDVGADLYKTPVASDKTASQFSWRSSGYQGVNLGGWLLWEPGPADATPLLESLESDDVPGDEWSLCEQLVAKHGRSGAEAVVHQHRSTHVTREDFVAIRKTGANSVRIPFGYWVITGPRDGDPFVGPGTEFLDSALDWGSELGLTIVLCYHAAVGFQSGEKPCGKADEEWTPDQFDIPASADVLRQVAQRYGQHSALAGICVLNEPSGEIPPAMLNEYFREAYFAMKNGGLPDAVQVILPIFHNEFKDHAGIYTEHNGFSNVLFDAHMYQVFGEPYAGWRHMSLAHHLRLATAKNSRTHTCKVIAEHGERVIVTEFCLELPTWHRWSKISKEHNALSIVEQNLLKRCFALRQLQAFAKYCEGWFFWCWRDDTSPQWSFRESSSRGWLPMLQGDELATQPPHKRQRTGTQF